MARQKTSLLGFNRGIMSTLGLQRIDLNRTAFSSEIQTNWTVRVLGSMSLRPGLEFIGETLGFTHCIPFVRDFDDKAILELTDLVMRVWIDDELISRVSVSTTITNGDFGGAGSWADTDEAGATSTIAGGQLSLVGTGTNEAKVIQTVTIVAADVGVEHALRIIVDRGPVTLRVGSTLDGDEYITERALRTGTHSLAFTPTGTFYISFSGRGIPAALVDSCQIESAGTMELPTPWDSDAVKLVRYWQENDVIFCACKDVQQRRLERQDTRSWSVVLYTSDTGPFMLENITEVTLTPSALTGDITLTASKPLFRSTQVGGLYRITSTGQTAQAVIASQNTFTDSIRVTGVGGQRAFSIVVTGVVDSTVTLQLSLDDSTWVDVRSYTFIASHTYTDELDNQLIYYRIGIKTGDYGTDTVDASLVFSSGSTTGVVRITAYTSTTVVSAAVLSPLGAITASAEWWEGFWSDRRGWPSAVLLFEARLYWMGKGWFWGSIVDAYDDFDDFYEGDAGPIIRSINGTSEQINWALDLDLLMCGTVMGEISAHSNTQDDPLTPTNFNMKRSSTQGSAVVDAVKLDEAGIYVGRSEQRVFQLEFKPTDSFGYKSTDLTIAVPDLNSAGIVQIAIQRHPDVRLHCVRADGTVAMLVLDREENVVCWLEMETDGLIFDVCILPGTEEDQVYYVVRRDGGWYLERWALESECVGGVENKQADSFVIYRSTGTPTSTLTGYDHLEGQTVVVWGDGVDLGTFTVTGGEVDLGETEVLLAVVGLGYTAQYKSARLGEATGTPLNLEKKVDHIGLILKNTHARGLRHGPTLEYLDDMPQVEQGKGVDADAIHEFYDEAMIDFSGEWNTNVRVCLEAAAPRPCTVLAVSVTMTVSDPVSARE